MQLNSPHHPPLLAVQSPHWPRRSDTAVLSVCTCVVPEIRYTIHGKNESGMLFFFFMQKVAQHILEHVFYLKDL